MEQSSPLPRRGGRRRRRLRRRARRRHAARGDRRLRRAPRGASSTPTAVRLRRARHRRRRVGLRVRHRASPTTRPRGSPPRRSPSRARARRVRGQPVELSALEPQQGTWTGPCGIDPFAVPLETSSPCSSPPTRRCAPKRRDAHQGAATALHAFHKWFGSTEGALIEQEWTESGAGIVAYAVGEGEVLTRSYPNSTAAAGCRAAGSTSLGARPASATPRASPSEAAALLTRPTCEPGDDHDLIIDGSQLGAAGARVDRPPDRARPRARRRGGVRGHLVPRRSTTSARCSTAREHRDRHRRRDGARVARQLRLGRRGRAGAARLHRRRRHARRAS